MKAAVMLVVAVLAGGAAAAGINPADPGLPVAQAYGTSYVDNRASAMCVDCHSATPVPGVGSHFVVHNSGAGVRTTSNTAWERLLAWTTSGGLSKYAIPAPPLVGSVSVTGSAGELICESCHNIVVNAAGGNNLLEPYGGTQDPSALCEGCHTVQAAGPPAHHPMTGDTVGKDGDDAAAHTLNTGHTSHLQAAPVAGSGVSYPAANGLNCISCHDVHRGQEEVGARILNRGSSEVPATLWAGEGSLVRAKPVNVIYYPGQPESGDARGDVKDWCADYPALGCVHPGLLRQQEITGFGATSTQRLVVNRDPLCDACHTY